MVLRREGPSHIIKDKTAGPDDPELLESLEEALTYASPDDLVAVADDLLARQPRFQELSARLVGGKLSGSPEDAAWLARSVTHSRKKARELEAVLLSGQADGLFPALLDASRPAPTRIAAFVNGLDGVDVRLRLELATGVLHNIAPKEYWLWTRWMWDRSTQTGILPLLAGSVHNLVADGVAMGYVNVGSVMAMAMRFGEGTGLLTPDLMEHPRRAAFANDVFLACAYSIYLYGITSWRLSREYNRLLPTMPNLMRKLLGLPKDSSQ